MSLKVRKNGSWVPIGISAKGAKGEKGVKGNKGNKGLKGNKGSSGSQGFKGIKGNKGEKGIKGAKGEKGIKGAKGISGIEGSKGNKGSKGLKGNKGFKGLKGEKGFVGEKGDKGLKGNKGEKGLKGIKGQKGELGNVGSQGIKGNKGLKGNKGFKGLKGEKGISGIEGSKGNKGNKGLKGNKGAKGAKGLDGTGVDGSKGNKGNKGPKGNKGLKGRKGLDGTGVDGSKGSKGNRGLKGNKGLKGRKGLDGIGIEGSKGNKGNKGLKGDKGKKGEVGNIGSEGIKGNKGNKGVKGNKGFKGDVLAKGAKGDKGRRGNKGNKGNKGKSGDEGNKGIKGNKGLKGNKGRPGIEGAGGLKGEKGNRGLKGNSGSKGEVGGTPIGQIIAWSGSATALPQGFFLCDGSLKNRNSYSALFNVIGYTHGGSGNSFRLPDLRNRFVIGAGGSYNVADTGGSANAILVSHSHTVNSHTHGTGSYSTAGAGTHNHSFTNQTGARGPQFIAFSREDLNPPAPTDGSGYRSGGNANDKIMEIQSVPNHTHSISGSSGASSPSTNSQGSSGTNANLPPYYALAYIIQYSQGGDVAKGEKGDRGQKGDAGVATKGEKGQQGSSVKGSKGSNIGGSLDYAHFRKSGSVSMIEDINADISSPVPIKFDVETFKGNVFGHSNTNNPERVSVLGNGIYNITANIGIESYQEYGDRPSIALYKNGNLILSTVHNSSRSALQGLDGYVVDRRFDTLKIVHTLELVSGDYIEIRGFRKYARITDGTQQIRTNVYECELVMTRSSGAVATSGSQGVQGVQGAQGEKGNKGNVGPSGSGGTPVGSIVAWPAPTIPTGWRVANGNPLSRAAYPELFAVLGTTYGAPDGNTFYIPDCQSRFLVGAGWSPLGGRGGSNTATLQEANLPSHFHHVAHGARVGVNPNTYTVGSTSQVAAGSGRSRWYESYNLAGTGGGANVGRSSFVGSGAAFNIIPLYQGVYWIIKVTP